MLNVESARAELWEGYQTTGKMAEQSVSVESIDKLNRSTSSAKRKMNDSSPNKVIPQRVSSWTRSTAEKLSIFYDSKAISISNFFEISRDSPYFVYPLDDENRKLLESLVDVTKRKMHKIRNPALLGTQMVQFVAEIEHCQEILDGLMELSENDEKSDPHILW